MLTAHEQLVMLAISRCGQRAYALSIQDEIAAHGQALTLGVLYTVLGRLERRQMVRYRDGDPAPDRGDRPRRYYSLTGAGAQELQASLRILDSLRAGAYAPRRT